MQTITFITGNPGKAKYLSDFFDLPVSHIKLDLPEIQSLDLGVVVKDKAERAFTVVQSPVLIEDVSLVFHGFGQLPGPFIKWFFDSLGNEDLCRLVDGLPDRSATALVDFALRDAHGMRVFSGSIPGSIAPTPRGMSGFGWDAIFIPEGSQHTWGEMTDEEKHQTSMRRAPLTELARYLADSGYGQEISASELG